MCLVGWVGGAVELGLGLVWSVGAAGVGLVQSWCGAGVGQVPGGHDTSSTPPGRGRLIHGQIA
eukprot:360936-Chlamydomonas_euryale.AAC.1